MKDTTPASDGSNYDGKQDFIGAPASSNILNAPDGVPGQSFDPKQRIQYSDASYTVHSTRPLEPAEKSIRPEIAKRHEQSVVDFPGLNLSAGEYVILFVQRHPIGLILQLASVIFLLIVFLLSLVYYPILFADPITRDVPAYGIVSMVLIGMMVLVSVGGYVATWVYRRNVMFLTNESIVLESQISLFARRERTVTLGSIEDAGFRQTGIMQMLFNYGTVKLSIEGDDTRYVFPYTANPKERTAIISNAIESFKSGRPVNG